MASCYNNIRQYKYICTESINKQKRSLARYRHTLHLMTREQEPQLALTQTIKARSWRLKWKTRIMILGVCLLILLTLNLQAKHTAAVTISVKQREAAAAASAVQATTDFDQNLASLAVANPGVSFSVATVSQASGLQTYGSSEPYDAASTGKLLTAVDYLHHVETGQASLHQMIDGQVAQQLLNVMITKSDDKAWNDLNNYLSHADLSNYARSNGLADYDPDTDSLPASDIAILLAKLNSGHLLRDRDRALLMQYMGLANYRQFIVAAVPAGETVYHKIGIDDDDVHDSAIITKNTQSLVLVIFTDGHGQYDWDKRAQLMREITSDALAAYL